LELAFDVAEKLVRLRPVGRPAEGADVEVGPAVAVHVPPAGAVAGNPAHVRPQPRLLGNVAEDEGRFRRVFLLRRSVRATHGCQYDVKATDGRQCEGEEISHGILPANTEPSGPLDARKARRYNRHVDTFSEEEPCDQEAK